ncbi:hypothetical protein CNBH2440 [Cryptococcus deneoformans B-3501A]|uniref:hypothetical protein n=1 Tax=Cryptococcus deneoformans (strain B-3501A) TaxID=283643 RepID=UPI000042EC5C|nr:hypothetical protein CNBH2440 [Cryptococcus neoformans var. neoformans B-3501A]EAL19145.1 hypothetical protein CNBH2440 [Cryptococcus neoformans var. neoformans B-3501A]
MLLSVITPLLLAAASYAQQSTPRVLVYSATAPDGYRHDSIPTAINVLGQNADKYGVQFVFSEDMQMFTNETLSGFDGVMFVSNSEEVLDAPGKAALQTFFQSGGVYTGVHSASTCLTDDVNYGLALGAFFDYHPPLQTATFERLNTTHPAVANVPDRWTFQEEVYYFSTNPRDNGAVVILTVDETSYVNNGSSQGDYSNIHGSPHPIAWYIESPLSAQPFAESVSKAGRSFYTSLGHLNSTWEDETFIGHLMGGLLWALDGASTKAYGVGVVGNATAPSTNQSTATVGGSSTHGGSTAATTAVTAVAASGSSSSESNGSEQVLPSSVLMALCVSILGAVFGMGLAL